MLEARYMFKGEKGNLELKIEDFSYYDVMTIADIEYEHLISVSALASQWKLSYERDISTYRKVCVYMDKEGNSKSVEQAKTQYCRTYL